MTVNTPESIHARWIRWIQYRNGWTLGQLAENSQINRSSLTLYRNGKRSPEEPAWQRLAEVAGVTPSQYWVGPPTEPTQEPARG